MQDISARQIESRCQFCTPRWLGMPLALHNFGAGEPQLDSRTGMNRIVNAAMPGHKASKQGAVRSIDNSLHPQGRDVAPPQAKVASDRLKSGNICNAAPLLLLLQIAILYL